MEKRIKIMEKVVLGAMMLALVVSGGLRGNYIDGLITAVAVVIGLAIGRALRGKPEPDERETQVGLMVSHAAFAAVTVFVIVMLALNHGMEAARQAYLNVLYAMLIAWFFSLVFFKKVWK